MPQIHQKVYNLTHNKPLGLSSTLFNATFRLENFRLFTMYHYSWFKGLGPLFPIVSMQQIYQQFNPKSTNNLYTWKTSCWIRNLKLQTLSNLYFIPSHRLEAVDNYNKEKLITTNKITPTTGINETVKMPLLKLFLYFSIRDNLY